MITDYGPKVIEFNCRFGDPETQAVLPLLDNDLAQIFMQIAEHNLSVERLNFRDQYCVGVVMASGGYPKSYQNGYEITGIDKANSEDRFVFHAGTELKDNKFITAGGRVLAVSAIAENLQDAIAHAYEGVDKIKFEDEHHRTDIAARASRRKFRITRQV